MKRVLIEELAPGMVLARPVTNAAGLPVVAAGSALSGIIIDRLRQLNLTSVYVEGTQDGSTGKMLAELLAEIDHRFRSVHQDPIQMRLVQLLKRHLQSTHGALTQEGTGAP